MKLLIVAYACSPYKGSEPGVGWGFVSELSKYHDLWVIVEEEKFREDLEQFLRINPNQLKSVRFYFIPKKRNRWLRKLWPPSYYWYYRRWHQDAYRLAIQLHREVNFDLTHQLTMVGFREPGYLWKLNIPFVWGPVGGMGFFPWRFLPKVGIYGALYYLGYNFFNWIHMNFLSRCRQAAQKAASGSANGLITATPENRESAEKYWECSSTVLPEVGLPREPSQKILERLANEPLRLVWVGQHTPGKALNIALQALSNVSADTKWELNVLGKGSQTSIWQQLAEKLRIDTCCHFHGWLPREHAFEVMQKAHGMIISSLRDLTSSVTVEALALGLPIVCLDHCGFAEVVDETCGIKIPVTTSSEAVAAMARAIEQLARDENKRQSLAWGALQRSRQYSWEEKARAVDRIYRAKAGNANISTTSEA